jgi:hypothetical protein
MVLLLFGCGVECTGERPSSSDSVRISSESSSEASRGAREFEAEVMAMESTGPTENSGREGISASRAS